MLYLFFFAAGLLAYGYYAYRGLVEKLMKPAPNYPDKTRVLAHKKIVVCAGDSITHGNMSHDWVSDLAKQNPDYQFFNAGKNADLSFTLLRRLDDVIAVQPHYINLLIGGNDVNFIMGNKNNYYDLNKVTRNDQPSLQTYTQNLTAIVQRLKSETSATISLMSFPILSEDLSHPVNQMADTYNEAVKKIAQQEGVIYLPLREKQKEFLKASGVVSKTRFEDTDWLIRKSGLAHHIFGTDWDTITRQNGNLLTFDNLHFNSVGAGMIQEMVESVLKNESF